MKFYKTAILSLIITLIGSLAFTNSAYSQGGDFTRAELQDLGDLGPSSEGVQTRTKTITQGHPYLNKDFLKGQAMINSSVTTKQIYLRLNTETNTVEFIRNDQIMAMDSKKIIGFRIIANDGNIIFKNGFNADVKNIDNNTFLRIVKDGDHKLLAHHFTTLIEDMASYGSANQKNKYVSHLNHYIVSPDGKFHEIKLRKNAKKDILDALGSHKAQIKQYVADQNLDYRSESDVGKIIEKYNQLSS